MLGRRRGPWTWVTTKKAVRGAMRASDGERSERRDAYAQAEREARDEAILAAAMEDPEVQAAAAAYETAAAKAESGRRQIEESVQRQLMADPEYVAGQAEIERLRSQLAADEAAFRAERGLGPAPSEIRDDYTIDYSDADDDWDDDDRDDW